MIGRATLSEQSALLVSTLESHSKHINLSFDEKGCMLAIYANILYGEVCSSSSETTFS